MAGTPNRFSRFWLELKRRKTDRVIVIYAAVAFTILQLVEPLISGLSLPDWTTTFIIIVLAIGFPLTTIFSWFFDITPGGIEKTKPVSDKKKHTAQEELRTWKSATLISIIIIIALILYNIIKGTIGSGEAVNAEKSIAVQPFRCLNDEDGLATDGVIFTDLITGALTNIENLTLRTWPPNLDYQEKKKSYPQIAKDLNVSFILKGTFNNLTNRIILIVQLIRASSESLLWGNNYVVDPEWKNINEIKNDIADNISKKLNATISERERSRINKKPSGNPVALRSYLEGSTGSQQVIFNVSSGKRIFEDLSNSKHFENVINAFDLAIENDSTFALAYAKRAIIRSWAYFHGHEGKTAVNKCKADIDKALELDEDLIEARIALGFYYYYCTFEYQKALDSFSYANSQQPNNWQCLYYMALVHRVLGNWNKSQKLLAKVLEFNPQDPLVLTNIGISEIYLRNYDDAISYNNKAIEIMPTWTDSYTNKIGAILIRDGNTAKARKVLDTATLNTGNSMRSMRILLDIYDEKYEEALHQVELSEPSDFENGRGEQLLTYGDIYRYLNETDIAFTFYQSALAFYKQELAIEPDNCKNLGSLGLAYAGLSKKTEAVEAGLKAVDLAKNNIIRLTDRITDLAKIYILVGEYNKALEQLESLLKNPSYISVKLLQLDPVWKPLQEKPEFKEIIRNYQ